jgi:hypothetical protein
MTTYGIDQIQYRYHCEVRPLRGPEHNAQGRFALAVRRRIVVILNCNMCRLLVCRQRHVTSPNVRLQI